MKKTLLTLVAILAATCAFAQDNLALGGTATASSTVRGNVANYAIDGDMTSRWESQESDAQWWQLDLGEAKTFNNVQIEWEGAYSKEFTLSVSNDGVNYTEVTHITDQVLNGDEYEGSQYKHCKKNYEFDDQTARYIKFTNIKRGTQWAVSFWEFRVFKLEAPVFTSILLEAGEPFVRVGEEVVLTAQGKNQLGSNFEVGPFEYEVTPADAGTVENGVFKSANIGDATIVAKYDGIVSNPVKVSVYTGEKIDVLANATVTPVNSETLTNANGQAMANAFDDDMTSLWRLYRETGSDEASRTYTCGFQIDFEQLWNVRAITASFEGACAEDYTMVAIDKDGNEFVLQEEVGHAGWNDYTDYFAFRDLENVRSIKWVSTKAATSWSVKIYDFSVYVEEVTADFEPLFTTNAIIGAIADLDEQGFKNFGGYTPSQIVAYADHVEVQNFLGVEGCNLHCDYTVDPDTDETFIYNVSVDAAEASEVRPLDDANMGVGSTVQVGEREFSFGMGKAEVAEASGYLLLNMTELKAEGNVQGYYYTAWGELATAIREAQAQANGKAVYNLAGQRVNAANSGLYIINGTKAVVK